MDEKNYSGPPPYSNYPGPPPYSGPPQYSNIEINPPYSNPPVQNPQYPPAYPALYPPSNNPQYVNPPYGAQPAQPYNPAGQPYYPQAGPSGYPPQTQGVSAVYQVPPPAMVIQANIAPINTIFGPYSVIAFCSKCKQNVSTRISYQIGCFVWLMFLVFYLVFPIISCVPFCMTTWYDAHHYCPKCSHRIGVYAPV